MNGRQVNVVVVASISFALTWLMMGLRVYVRAVMLKTFGYDDWTMLVTQILFTFYIVCQIAGHAYGIGQHVEDLKPWRAERAFCFWYFCEIFYVMSIVVMKMAIGLFLLRVANVPLHVWIIRMVMVIAGICGTAYLIFLAFQCWPVSTFWSLDPHQDRCVPAEIMVDITYAINCLGIIADFTFALLPIAIVRDLQMSRRQRGMVAGILSLATIGATATVIRMPYLHSLKESYAGRDGDFLYDTTYVAIWSTVENALGIIAGCIATLRPLLQLVITKMNIQSSSGSGGIRHLQINDSGKPKRVRSPAFTLTSLGEEHGIVTTISGNGNVNRTHSLWKSKRPSQERLATLGAHSKQMDVECDDMTSLQMSESAHTRDHSQTEGLEL